MGVRLWFSYVEQSILMEYQLEYYILKFKVKLKPELWQSSAAALSSSLSSMNLLLHCGQVRPTGY